MQSLSSFHTFGLASSALNISTIKSVDELRKTLIQLRDTRYYVLGEGSNTIFLSDYIGTILRLGINGIDVQEHENSYQISVGAGINWHYLVLWCLQKNIFGFENLAMIPGSVGAAPIQNIGAYGVEIERFIKCVEYFDLYDEQLKKVDKSKCEFDYRNSVFKSTLAGRAIIVSVVFELPKKWLAVAHYGELKSLINPSPQDVFNKVVEIRNAKLPLPSKIGNAGSFFKNPVIALDHYTQLQKTWPSIPSYPLEADKVKVPAAWLIDKLGFKGKKIGGIGCHPNQALVLTNDGSGTGEQLLQLARAIKSAVLQEFSIVLENEVRLIGKHGPVTL